MDERDAGVDLAVAVDRLGAAAAAKGVELVAKVERIRLGAREVREIVGMRDVARVPEERLAVDYGPADVVDVQVREDDEVDVVGRDAVPAELVDEAALPVGHERAAACRPDAGVDKHV